MFHSLVVQIRRLPWWGQAFAWPLFGIFWLGCQIVLAFVQMLGWMFKELGGQAKTGAKKMFAPLLWPAVAVLGLFGLVAALGSQQTQMLLAPLLAIGIMLLGFRIMVAGIWPMGKKKKK